MCLAAAGTGNCQRRLEIGNSACRAHGFNRNNDDNGKSDKWLQCAETFAIYIIYKGTYTI